MSTRTASEVYALSQGAECVGPEQCHYCAGPCARSFTHGEPIGLFTGMPVGGVRKRPSCPYVCIGCWLWRRKRRGVAYMGGGNKENTTPCRHSWYVTPNGAWAISDQSAPTLYARLLSPPPLFFLAFIEGDPSPDNLIQLGHANDNGRLNADTELTFTINNVPYRYTVYELEQAALTGPQGREPGVQALLRILGQVPSDLIKHVVVAETPEEKREKGRPVKTPDNRPNDLKRPIKNIKG